jgi:hypothetical protein
MTACTKIELFGWIKQQLKKHIRYNWWETAFLCKRRKICFCSSIQGSLQSTKKERPDGLSFN